jgi:hypothetical protein
MTYLYLLKAHNKAAYKIGITNNPKRRFKEIYSDTPCIFLFAVPLLWAEWFYFWLPFRPALWILCFFSLQVFSILMIIFLIIKSF